MNVVDNIELWRSFLKRRETEELNRLIREFPFKKNITIPILDLSYCRSITYHGIPVDDYLLEKPDEVIEDIQLALHGMDDRLTGVEVHFIKNPKKYEIRDINSSKINRFVSFEGMVRKVSDNKPMVTTAVYRCVCNNTIRVPQSGFNLVAPTRPCTCGAFRWTIDPVESSYTDSQWIRIQEFHHGKEQPQTIDVLATGSNCRRVSPGDVVAINGVVRTYQRNKKDKDFNMYITCNSIEIMECSYADIKINAEDEKRILELSKKDNVFEMLSSSIAPFIYGFATVKQAITLQLFGGTPKHLPDKTKIRGDIHILLIGDPAIAKSQLINYVVSLSPRGVSASGKSTTTAGLTASAVQDTSFGDGRWTLEAGAMVLADGGICAIDEFDKMDEKERGALHEAMEQQYISVAKAGIVTRLFCRCAVLGAANPKLGRFDPFVPINEQITMPPSLLSRFDLIFILSDTVDEDRDKKLALHVISTHKCFQQNSKNGITCLEPEFIRKYIAYAKNITPVLTPEAEKSLIDYYMNIRKLSSQSKPVPITVRQLEALVRLSEASAKTRLSKEITLLDTNRVISIVDSCLRQIAYDPESGMLDIDRVVSNMGKNKRSRAFILMETIKEVEAEEGVAKMDLVLKKMEIKGYSPLSTSKLITDLINDGLILQPRNGQLKVL